VEKVLEKLETTESTTLAIKRGVGGKIRTLAIKRGVGGKI
jgi:hypothetical protein